MNKIILAIQTIILAVLIVMITSCEGNAFNPLEYIEPETDKQIHILTNYVITDYVQDTCEWEWWQSYLLIEVLGIAKEYMDVRAGGKWDSNDQMANRKGWLLKQVLSIKIEF